MDEGYDAINIDGPEHWPPAGRWSRARRGV